MSRWCQNFLINVLIVIITLTVTCTKQTDNNLQTVKRIIIYPNETALEVALKLHDNGIISNTKTFLFWGRVLGYDKKIKSGRYKFIPNSKSLAVLKILSRGGENKVLIIIPEGYNIKEIARLLENEGICSEKLFIKACSDKTLLRSLNINTPIAEGYLFPDSYDFTISQDPSEIIERMVKRFWQIYNEIVKSKNQKSIDTIVTIASLVEKEAKLENERPIIASVFYNRLRYKMLLQSCATVEYVLSNHKEQLSIEDTKIQSPYNTYLHRGLPPTPICNPGRASLVAATQPVQTKYLYFAVDNNSSHHFSKSFTEHQNFLRNKARKATDTH
jgi:UPF0755 protein